MQFTTLKFHLYQQSRRPENIPNLFFSVRQDSSPRHVPPARIRSSRKPHLQGPLTLGLAPARLAPPPFRRGARASRALRTNCSFFTFSCDSFQFPHFFSYIKGKHSSGKCHGTQIQTIRGAHLQRRLHVQQDYARPGNRPGRR